REETGPASLPAPEQGGSPSPVHLPGHGNGAEPPAEKPAPPAAAEPAFSTEDVPEGFVRSNDGFWAY
ncbi:MAG: hypothetical protein ACPLRH_06750, partial [Desulfotomaculales bacterium]